MRVEEITCPQVSRKPPSAAGDVPTRTAPSLSWSARGGWRGRGRGCLRGVNPGAFWDCELGEGIAKTMFREITSLAPARSLPPPTPPQRHRLRRRRRRRRRRPSPRAARRPRRAA
eukprot:1499729-Pyramimonas_sp.AAC.1